MAARTVAVRTKRCLAQPRIALPAHDPGDAMTTGRFALEAERTPDPRRTVRLAALPVHGTDPLGEPFVVAVAARGLATAPGVVAAAGDLQDLAHHAYPEGLPVLLDEPELHFWSSAK